MSMSCEISAFIAEHLRARGFALLSQGFDKLDLFESGAIDSLGAMHFAAALEARFDIELTDQDILSEDFRYVGGVSLLVRRAIERRQSAAA
jgi:acyl carrier protein